ncbi:MAG: hypothetical protein IJ149_10050 [Oscillospiraceae bacterium]|nr:hypothetical protein [Oscillospiraceae bacterium]
MKKLIAALIAGAVACVLLASCTGGGTVTHEAATMTDSGELVEEDK